MNSDDVEVRKERTAASGEAGDFPAGGAYRGPQPPASIYAATLPAIALMAGLSGFGASALSLAFLGLGVPFLLAALIAGVWAGLLTYVFGRWMLGR